MIRSGKIASSEDPGTSRATTVDLEGVTVLPGFIDSHSHWIGDRDLVRQDVYRAIDSALAQGWTSISELFVNEARLSELCTLEGAGDLRLKVGAFLPINYEFERWHWYGDYEPGLVLGPHLFLQGVKIFADRSADGLGYQTEPPDPVMQGVLFWHPDELAAEVEAAHEAGWQIAVHATGDGGLELALAAFEPIGRAEIVAARHRIEHASTVRDDQVDRMADLGLIASIQRSWFHADAAKDLVRWVGRDRVTFTGRWRDLVNAGIPIAGGTDRPFALVGESGDSVDAIAFAVTRRGPTGERPPPWMATQKLTVWEVLRSLTIDAAFAQGTEDSVGSIEPGKAADLVVLSADPTRVRPRDLQMIKVVATIVDGRVEYCALTVPSDLLPFCPSES
ncbi:MAG TPA: amidohydrolase family protein [Actinomycetota bacterium]|nr:amidohydrolase family protein [Actinomycetota bacterium]